MPLVNQNAQNHQWKEFPKRGYCVWCKEHGEKFKTNRIRPILAEIVNGATSAGRQRPPRSYGGCIGCNVHLCRKGACFKLYHGSDNNK
jgi:hypothetical protein